MLTGTTTIELTDTQTGEKTVYEDHNTVTNALNWILKQHGYIKNSELFLAGSGESTNLTGGFRPFYKNLLGGLLLFDKAIDANNGNTIFAPRDANLIGCGVYNKQSAVSDKVLGSYNASESGMLGRSMKFVYDFSTSQANGTISNVCLTSLNGGHVSYGHPDGLSGTAVGGFHRLSVSNCTDYYRSDAQLLAIDPANNCAYYLKANSKTDVSVLKYFIGFTKMSVFDAQNAARLLEEKHYTVNLTNTNLICNYSEKTNSVYLTSGGSLSAGASINLFKISLDDDSVESYTFLNSTEAYVNLGNSCFSSSAFYAAGGSPYTVYRAKYDDVSTITDTNPGYSSLYDFGCFEIGDSDYLYNKNDNGNVNTTVKMRRIQEDGIAVPTGICNGMTNVNIVPVIGANGLAFYNCDLRSSISRSFVMPMNFLATINNLSAPVTKTEAQTMKVIYTITESDAS